MLTANEIYRKLVNQWGDRQPPLAYPIDIEDLCILLESGGIKIKFNQSNGNSFEHTINYNSRLFTAITVVAISE